MITGLVIAGGGFQGLPMIQSLRALDARVIVADSNSLSPNRYLADQYTVMPPVANESEFASALLALCGSERVDVVLPSTSFELLALAALAPEIRRAGSVVAISSRELIAAWSDKPSCLRSLGESGLPVLPILDSTDAWSGPVIGKPRAGWGSRGIVVAQTEHALAEAHARDTQGQLFWQPHLKSFTEWSVDFAIDEQGTVSPLVLRERLHTSGGFAVLSRVHSSPPVAATAEAVSRLLSSRGGCGVFNLQILVDEAGAQWVNDLNFRPGTSSTAALGDGVNFPAFLLGLRQRERKPRDFLHIRSLADRCAPILSGCRIRGVAFDLDDCLIDHKAWMDDKLTLLLEDGELFDDPEQRRRFAMHARRTIDEGPWDRLIDVALERSALSPVLAERLIGRWRAAHPEAISIHRDAAVAVAALKRAGIRLAIVSDNPAFGQRQKLARLTADLQPDAVVLTAEIGAPKPSGDAYSLAAKRLNVDPDEMLAVGDSPWRDAVGALAAGYAAAVISPRSGAMGNPSRERFERAYPDAAARTFWVDDLRLLPAMLAPVDVGPE